MKKLTLALISGGDSPERQVSLSSGDQVFEALDKEKYRIMRFDPKTDLAELAAGASHFDAALIVLHGPFGEDGTLQGMLDLLDIPYQGSGVLGSALSMDKQVAKQMCKNAGLQVPPHLLLKKDGPLDPEMLTDQLGLPLVIKPVVGGSSIGMSIVKSKEAIPVAIEKAFEHDRSALAEAYLSGTELTCAVIGNDRLEAYPVVEIRPGKGFEFFDYTAKYTAGATTEICPAEIPDHVAAQVQAIAIKAHTVLCCRGYSRTDMILSDEKLYVIETNTIPGMTRTSLLPLAAQAAGVDFSNLLDKLILLSLEDYIKKSNIRDHNRLQRIRQALPILSEKKIGTTKAQRAQRNAKKETSIRDFVSSVPIKPDSLGRFTGFIFTFLYCFWYCFSFVIFVPLWFHSFSFYVYGGSYESSGSRRRRQRACPGMENRPKPES